MKVVVKKDYEEASKYVADMFIDLVKTDPEAVIGLATGSSPVRAYELMQEDHKNHGTSWQGVKSYNLDEYCGLAPDHPQSYHYFMHKQLFDGLDVKEDNIHVPDGLNNPEAECDRYTKMLAENPRDLQLLGIGSNGHIGFNEPGTSFTSHTHKVALKQSTIKDNARLFFDGDEEAVPHFAVTMGIADIMDAKKIVLIACGERKAEAVKGLVEGPVSEDLPASVLQNHPDAVIVVDEAAASLLKK